MLLTLVLISLIIIWIGTGYPSLSGLYNFLSDTPNYLRQKRHHKSEEFFGQFAPYEPKHAAEYRSETNNIVENAIIDSMKIHKKFFAKDFSPIQVNRLYHCNDRLKISRTMITHCHWPVNDSFQMVHNWTQFLWLQGSNGNFTLPEFIHFAEHLIQETSNQTAPSPAILNAASDIPIHLSANLTTETKKNSTTGENVNLPKNKSKRRYKRKVWTKREQMTFHFF